MKNAYTSRLSALFLSLLLALAASGGTSLAQEPQELRIGGTGTALGGMQLLAEAYEKAHPEVSATVLPSLGSAGGIKALIAGKIDIALSARRLKEKEAAERIVAWEYARTPIVFAVNEDNVTDAISLQEAVAIYSGERTQWSDGGPIRLILRPETENDIQLLKDMSPEMKAAVESALARPELHVAMNDQDNAEVLEQVRGALGVTTLAQILAEERDLKPLAFEGQEGTVEALRVGSYPYAKLLYVVSRVHEQGAVADFLAFVASPAGQDILRSSGHLPIDGRPKG